MTALCEVCGRGGCYDRGASVPCLTLALTRALAERDEAREKLEQSERLRKDAQSALYLVATGVAPSRVVTFDDESATTPTASEIE